MAKMHPSYLIISLSALGLLAGIAFWQANRTGYFVSWQRLPDPPYEVTELVTSREFDLYVTVADSRSLHWDSNSWEFAEVPEGLEEGWTIIKPCRMSWPEFWPLSNAPKDVVGCIQDSGVYAEFVNKHVYVIDDKGDIWRWELLTHGLAVLFQMFLFPCIGILIGLLLAFIIIGYGWARQRYEIA